MIDFAPFLGSADDTMVRRLFGHAERQPDRLAYAFVPELETAATARLSYAELVVAAGEFAAGLEDWFAARPDQPRMALLLFPAGLEFLVAFWGCLMARTVAIPAAMPRSGRPAPIVEAIARNSGVHLVVTRTQQADAIRQVLAASPVLSGLALEIDAVLAAAGPCPIRHRRRTSRFYSILGFHQHAQGRDGPPWQPARQRADDLARHGDRRGDKLRQLAAPLSRHGADRQSVAPDL